MIIIVKKYIFNYILKALLNSKQIGNDMAEENSLLTQAQLIKLESRRLTSPKLLRLYFVSDAFESLPENIAGLHCSLFFPKAHQDLPPLPRFTSYGTVWPNPDDKAVVRSYTIRTFNCQQLSMSIEFVLRDDMGPGLTWAKTAAIGSQLGFAGPGGELPLIPNGDFKIYVGDLSSLPGITALVSSLPADSLGVIFLYVPDESCRLDLKVPPLFRVFWAYAKHEHLNQIKVFPFPSQEKLSAYITGESSDVLAVRKILRGLLGLSKKEMFILPFWRRKKNEEEYQSLRLQEVNDLF